VIDLIYLSELQIPDGDSYGHSLAALFGFFQPYVKEESGMEATPGPNILADLLVLP
jgi:hypothetical protein